MMYLIQDEPIFIATGSATPTVIHDLFDIQLISTILNRQCNKLIGTVRSGRMSHLTLTTLDQFSSYTVEYLFNIDIQSLFEL